MKIIYNYLQRLLPVGYVELEYIQSTGTQYIDTGFTPNQDTKVDLSIIVTAYNNGNGAICGGRDTYSSRNYSIVLGGTGNTIFSGYNQQNDSTGIIITLNTLHKIVKDKNTLYYDGSLISTYTYGSFTSPYTMWIFGVHQTSADAFLLKSKLYACKIYNDNVIVRNYIPCYRYSDGVEGLYDIVGKQFYTNQGTGRFIRGKEINSGNLLNLSKFVRGYPSNTGFDKATKRTFTQNTYIQGIASNNYYSPTTVSNINITEQTVTIYGQSGYGIAFVAGLKPNCTYKLHCKETSAQAVYVMYYANDGTFLSSVNLGLGVSERTLTTISDFAYAIIDFVPTNQTTAIFSNIALHESVN